MLKKIILWIFVILISVQIFSFSGADAAKSDETSKRVAAPIVEIIKRVADIPQNEETELLEGCNRFIRKAAHFSEYMLLAFFAAALCGAYRLKTRPVLLISAGYSLIIAFADEFYQLFVNGRSGRITDVLIDFSGALFGIALFCLLRRLIPSLKK